MIFIQYPKCTTCKKAKKFLDDNKVNYINKNIIEENPSKKDLKDYINLSNITINKFFNTSGLKYRQLNLKDKIKTMSDDEKLDLLASDGMLVKRPILVGDDFVLVGFKQEQWEDIVKRL